MSATGKAAQIADALLARAETMAIGTPPYEIAMPGVAFTPVADVPYLEVGFFTSPPLAEGLSAGVIDQGRLVVGVCWPKKIPGVVKPLEAAEAVKAHFPKGLQLKSGTTNVRVHKEPYAGAPITLPDRIVVPVTVPWTA